jgi:hypothetical protein
MGEKVTDTEKRIATPEVREHAFDGVGDEYGIELQSLALVEGGEGQPIVIGSVVAQERSGLELLLVGEAPVVVEGRGRIAFVPTVEDLSE